MTKAPRKRRLSAIHRKVQELGCPGLGEYLSRRYVQEKATVAEMAQECAVRENTIRRHLHLYGFTVAPGGTHRRRKGYNQVRRRGRNMICRVCGALRYYSPAQLANLQEANYMCRGCRSDMAYSTLFAGNGKKPRPEDLEESTVDPDLDLDELLEEEEEEEELEDEEATDV